MPVQLTDPPCLLISGENGSFAPNAEEIYSVVFEGATVVRGAPVSATDFLQTGVDFTKYTADPVLLLAAEEQAGGRSIVCRLVARSGAGEALVARHGDELLDYAIAGGRWLPLPRGAVEEAARLVRETGAQPFGRLTLAQYMRILQVTTAGVAIEDRTEGALSATTVAPTVGEGVPAGFVGTLYPYQKDGFHWLSFMVGEGVGAIIADEMGLGKTVQVICVLLEAVAAGRSPNLVICTATLLENWRRELARFAPGLRVLVHSGARRTGFPEELKAADVVIASYETTVVDVSLFRNVRWNLVVVDEAQNIRNPGSKRTVQIKTLPRASAVAVTGTPVENRLTDLWSITDFVLPSLLGSLAQFERRHPDSMAGAADLEQVISPLLLRRTVAEVADDLPPRIDIPQPLSLDDASAHAYEELRAATAGTAAGAAHLGLLTGLRMFCTHPWLSDRFLDLNDPAECSPKLHRLVELMEEIVEQGGKALVFTSYTEAVDLLVREAGARFGVFSAALDGRTPVPERQRRVDEFSAVQGAGVLVLNPKAAGTGLNIVAANHVIHFNPEWNPAVEDQASARAHRRGQTRPVTIHRLFYVDTVEEVMSDRMDRKRQLAAAAVVGTDGKEQEVADIVRALKISPLRAQ